MIKYILIASLVFLLFAKSKTEITANKFEVYNKKHITKFIGNVKVIQAQDRIYSDFIDVLTNNNNKPIKYDAQNNVRFKIKNQNDYYRGTCDRLIYEPKTKKYTLLGNVRIDQNNDSKILIGDKILIYKDSGKAEVFGKEKPVKFIFDNDN